MVRMGTVRQWVPWAQFSMSQMCAMDGGGGAGDVGEAGSAAGQHKLRGASRGHGDLGTTHGHINTPSSPRRFPSDRCQALSPSRGLWDSSISADFQHSGLGYGLIRGWSWAGRVLTEFWQLYSRGFFGDLGLLDPPVDSLR